MTRAGPALALAALLAGPLACGPWGPLGVVPGGPLAGEEEPGPVSDWSFSDDHALVAVETRGGWLRHSVTVLCVQVDGTLHLMARHAPRKRWVQNLLADPRVRLEIGGRIYRGRATRVTDPLPSAAVARAFLRKYAGIDAETVRALGGPPAPGDTRAEVWMFRVDPEEVPS